MEHLMRFKIDENLPHGLTEILIAVGHEADSVFQEKLSGTPDMMLWPIVQRERRTFVTRDLDFADIRMFPSGSHFGIVMVRCSDVRRVALITRIREMFMAFATDDRTGCHIVISDEAVRIRRPE